MAAGITENQVKKRVGIISKLNLMVTVNADVLGFLTTALALILAALGGLGGLGL